MKEYMMTQKEFAEFLGIHYTHYNRIENNQMQATLEKALIISEKLGRPVNDIFYLSE